MVFTVMEWSGEGSEVKVAGDFSEWQPRPATNVDGRWKMEIDLQPGRYAFKWIVNGNWVTDDTQLTETDQSGNRNNIIIVETPSPTQTNVTMPDTPKTSGETQEGSRPTSVVSGDSDSWEQVSVGDCNDKPEKEIKMESSGSEEGFEVAGLTKTSEEKKVNIERTFSPTDEYYKTITSVGEKLDSFEYPVMYWDTPSYSLMKEGVWLKQLQDKWLLRKLNNKGVTTVRDKSEMEQTLSTILGTQGSFDDHLSKVLTHKIEFEGSNTRWEVGGLEVQHLKEGDLHTVNIRSNDNLGDGLKKIYETATNLNLNAFKLI